MENGEGVGPDNIPIEVSEAIGHAGVNIPTTLLQRIEKVTKMAWDGQQSLLIHP